MRHFQRPRRTRRIPANKLCVARVPSSLYKKEPTRCTKTARAMVHGLNLCRHHEKVARRGTLEVWAPALEGASR